MIYPIVAYGHPVLKQKAKPIGSDYPELAILIDNMFQTMYQANGVGLAAPQIGLGIRLFVVDASPFAEEDPSLVNFKQVFINAQIIEEQGESWRFNEGCLSIPHIREDVERNPEILLSFQNEKFEYFEQRFTGIAARIIQHEYDHIEGILFVDRLNPLKKTLLKGKLTDISKGKVKVEYKMKFYQLKR